MTTSAQRAYTTFEVAKACGVFHTTVINWVNKGKLKAHSTPGGHRRILATDLVDFMKQFDMPIPPDLLERPKKALVVEDDPAVQRMLMRALKDQPGLETQVCSGGLEALIAIGKEAPDLLILDIRIPQVNGLDVCKLLRSNDLTRQIRIIVVSGEALSLEDEHFLKVHADGLFRKPLSVSLLSKKVADLLGVAVVP